MGGNRRNTEALLLLAACPAVLLLFAMWLVNDGEALTFSSLAVPLGLIGSFAIAHLAVRKFAPNADPAILPIVFLISGIGIAFVMRLAPDDALRQVLWLFVSIVAMIATLIIVRSVDSLSRYKYTIGILGIVLLILPMIFGTYINGAKNWIVIGSFSFQPAEIAKVCIVIFLASYLAENRERLSISGGKLRGVPDLSAMLPLFIIWILALLVVIFERELGTAILFFGLFLIMIYVATGRKFYVVIGLALIAVGGTGLYTMFDHVQVRVYAWLHCFDDPLDTGMQLCQSLFSIADGGFFGAGIGRGLCDMIPVVSSDFIFSAIAEETGLLGASGVLLLFMLFAIRGALTAARAKSDTAALLATGLTAAISLQAFVIIGGVTGLIPLTGVTLPFMSQGGSSLLASFIIVALLLRAGDEGTGLETEISSEVSRGRHGEGGLLGRYALGKRLTFFVIFFATLFAILIGTLTYIQVINADNIQNMSINNHTTAHVASTERGAILTSDDVVLAESVENANGTYDRVYPEGSLASHVVGYVSSNYGNAGIELRMSDSLLGNKNFSTWASVIESLSGGKTTGNDVVLTINSQIQKACENVLANQTGAIVIMDTKTGAVYACASSPTYSNDDLESVISSGGTELYDRATQALYAPGSTFKVVTLSAALENGTTTLSKKYDGPGVKEIGGGKIINNNSVSYGTITTERALAYSVNTVFSQVAVEVGAKALVNMAKAYGFGTSLGQDFDTAESLMPDPDEMTEWELAWAGNGQPVGEHDSPAGPQVTVMQMCTIAAAIANGGEVMNPYLVDKVVATNGTIVSQTSPESLGNATSKATAQKVYSAMKTVVESGTASSAKIAGATVVGKTGTAETDNDKPDAWFIGSADDGNSSIAIAIVFEQGSTQGACDSAGTLLATALRVLSE